MRLSSLLAPNELPSCAHPRPLPNSASDSCPASALLSAGPNPSNPSQSWDSDECPPHLRRPQLAGVAAMRQAERSGSAASFLPQDAREISLSDVACRDAP